MCVSEDGKLSPSHTQYKLTSIGEAVVRRPPEPHGTREKTVKSLPRRCLKVYVKVVRSGFKLSTTLRSTSSPSHDPFLCERASKYELQC